MLLDADLAVLGQRAGRLPGVRHRRARRVRATSTTRLVAAGRGAVLRGLLDREPLYSTADGRGRWEARARANMTAELAALG